MVLVRPETVELQPADGDGAGSLTGEIISHTFLGRVDAPEDRLGRRRPDRRRARLARANAYPVGMTRAGALPGRDGAGCSASKRPSS